MKDVIKIKKPNQVSNVKVSHEASSFYADLSKQWAIKLDKPIENNEYSSKFYAKISEQNADSAQKSANSAKEVASNLERIVTNSLYFPELKISNEDVILKKLEREKRSTFDKSKFTVVGSPTITDDGVASGFSNGNYLSLPVTTFGNKFKIVSSFVCPNSLGIDTIYSGQTIQLIALSIQNKKLAMNIGNGNSWVSGDRYGITPLEINKKYLIMFQYENGKYSLYLSVDNGASWKQEITYYSSSQIMPNNVTLKIGQGRISGSPFTGSIDLKQFSITVDDKEVFNGNKTGIDNIKADSYEVVGSPIISDDGVVSGFSSSNYVKKDNVITIGSNGEFHIDFKFNCEHYTDYQYILDLHKTTSDEIIIRRNIDNSYHCVCFVSGKAIFNKSINIAEDDIEGYIEYKNNTYTLKINNSIETLISSVKMSALDYNLTFGCRGAYSNAQPLINGSIDLNSFKIYVDGNLVYQPCLKIPYTQSKTGSKIVDGIYRDRVQDLYEQCGYTHYYTLGDTDFTLATCKGSDIIESGENYEQTADLTLKQWGSATSGQTVNLLPYKDTNYAVTLANGSKTKSSFVANATGDYFAVGKTVLG